MPPVEIPEAEVVVVHEFDPSLAADFPDQVAYAHVICRVSCRIDFHCRHAYTCTKLVHGSIEV